MAEHMRIWRYRVAPEQCEAFVHHYATEGTWTQLFQRAEGYLGTTLWQDAADETLWYTQDQWRSESNFRDFEEQYGVVYKELDSELEGLATEETFLGACNRVDA